MTLFSFVNQPNSARGLVIILGTGETMILIPSPAMSSDASPSNFVIITSQK